MASRTPAWLPISLALVGGAVVLYLERRRPLRHPTEPGPRRLARNFGVALMAGASLQLVERPLIRRLTALVERHRIGLLQRAPLPRWARATMGLLLLDYTLYLWHVLTHRVPLLWRFHLVHHVDMDLDASTALRFHAGELVLSVGWRAGQVLLLGIGPRTLAQWQAALLASVFFQHSNIRLPVRLERCLGRLLMTPRLHGIHHSASSDERNANWSSGLTLWDLLHRTFRQEVPQKEITIGVAGYADPAQLTLGRILRLPFVDDPDDPRAGISCMRPPRCEASMRHAPRSRAV